MPSMDTIASREQFWIEWDMGDYGPFDTEAEARAYQREHRMTGSSIDRG
ncbi:hypothetical protein SEA_MARSHAWN_88 [Mycobacterium phage Marshawn]|uniref:Uncharacterized protein n=1 Tax=Mycobacterium phage Marshawn TaxID=2652423 RepID=A0A5P8D765_9CAUD|nr:hypothetical protein I5H02_gp11 [Mycobacterium phage Marshawn]QFP94874.1 hypothetical protein SEA_MARSHAWN_88 [Mycobacterium phage Marshawn]